MRKDIADLLAVIDPVFQRTFLNVLEQDLHRRRSRDGLEWRIILEAYLVTNIPSGERLAKISKKFYELPTDESYNLLRSLGHDNRVSI